MQRVVRELGVIAVFLAGYGNWLFVRNGFIADFHLLRRDLMLAIDPDKFADVQG